MGKIFLLISLLICLDVQAQKKKYSISLNLRPEITFYQLSKGYPWKEYTKLHQLNPGFEAIFQYHLPKNFFLESGIGFISREFKTDLTFLSFIQGVIPPPRQSGTQELVIVKRVKYTVVEFPFSFGYTHQITNKTKSTLKGGYVFNYLWSADYGEIRQYSGSYSKRYWLGSSPSLGLGMDRKIKKTWELTSSLNFIFEKMKTKDPYLHGEGQYGFAIKHRFICISLGVKKKF